MRIYSLAWALLLAAATAFGQGAPVQPVAPTQQNRAEGRPDGQTEVPPANTIDGAPDAADLAPTIVLEKALTAESPQRFAERLAAMFGAEVRLPRAATKDLSLPAGKWTATELLDQLARRTDTAWRQVFVFGTLPKGVPLPKPRLASVGNLRPQLYQRSFRKAVRELSRDAGCAVVLPKELPPGRFSLYSLQPVPVERALQELGAQAKLAVWPVVLFETEAERGEDVLRAETTARLTEEDKDRTALISWLEDTYGAHPYSDEFPWQNLELDGVGPAAQAALDLSREEFEQLVNQLQLTALTMAELRQRGEAGEILPGG